MKKIAHNKKILAGISCASVVVVFLVWWLYCDVFKLVPNAVFPGPDKVITTFITKLYSTKPEGATLFGHAFSSLKVCLLGYILGAVVGIPLGIMMAWNKWVDRFARPLFDLIRPVPGLAWIPLFILLFGIGIASKAMIIFLSAFVACTVNAYTGIRQTSLEHLWVGDVFGATDAQKLFRIAIPTATPMIFTGLRTALGTSWMALVAAEMLAASEGLGYMISQARTIARCDIVIVGMLTIGLIGLLLDVLLHAVEIRVAKGMNAK